MKRKADCTSPEIDAGRRELERGSWNLARQHFEKAIQQGESAESFEGLAWALWWLGEGDQLIAARERAYALFRQRGDLVSAARQAIWLAGDHVEFKGELCIANGWRQRARSLLQDLDPVSEHGWLAMQTGAVAIEVEHDAETALRWAQETTAIGRTVGSPDLEILGLAMQGLALVSLGDIQEGMARLDEAGVAACSGELREPISVAWTFCYLIYACERVRDYPRAAEWCVKMEEFSHRFSFRFATAVCRAHYAGVLLWRGHWSEAEVELSQATEDFKSSRPLQVGESLVRLGELRRRQGNWAEAEDLFRRAELHPLSLLGRAELAIDQGDLQRALELVERYQRHVPSHSKTMQVPARELLVRIFSLLQDPARAEEHLEILISLASGLRTQAVHASLALAEALVAAQRGETERAQQRLEDALISFQRTAAPFEVARTRLELSKVLASLGRREAAILEAQTALEVFQDMGAGHEARQADQLLARLRPRRKGREDLPGGGGRLTGRELEVLRLVAGGMSDKEIAATLFLSEHTIHRHVANILNKLAAPTRAAAAAQLSSLEGL